MSYYLDMCIRVCPSSDILRNYRVNERRSAATILVSTDNTNLHLSLIWSIFGPPHTAINWPLFRLKRKSSLGGQCLYVCKHLDSCMSVWLSVCLSLCESMQQMWATFSAYTALSSMSKLLRATRSKLFIEIIFDFNVPVYTRVHVRVCVCVRARACVTARVCRWRVCVR